MIKTNRPSKSQSLLLSTLLKCFIVLFVGSVAVYNIFYILKRRANLSLILITSDYNYKSNSLQNTIEQLDERELHIVFSTDCTYFQDWQSIVLFHSAKTVKQKGKITRIASGCTADKAEQLKDLYYKLFLITSIIYISRLIINELRGDGGRRMTSITNLLVI